MAKKIRAVGRPKRTAAKAVPPQTPGATAGSMRSRAEAALPSKKPPKPRKGS